MKDWIFDWQIESSLIQSILDKKIKILGISKRRRAL